MTTYHWEELNPLYSEPPSNIIQLRSDIPNGTFLLFRETPDSDQRVGRIVKCRRVRRNHQHRLDLVVNMFETLSSFNGELPILKLQDSFARNVCEVVQTVELATFEANNLFEIELAFVFGADALRHGIASNCQGINNVFLCRFRTYEHLVDPITIIPFASQEKTYATRYASCYPSRIWSSLVVVLGLLRKGLDRFSERQGDFVRFSCKTPLSGECFDYLCRRCRGVVEPIERSSRILRPRLLPDFKSETIRIELPAQLLRFETEDQLKCFRSMFGNLSTYGVRRRRARVGMPKYLQENDTLNAVIGVETAPQSFHLRTTDNGIDLMFDSVELHVTIRYEKYIHATTGSGAPLVCRCNYLKDLLHNNSSSGESNAAPNAITLVNPSIITIGAMFEHNSQLLKVSSVHANEVRATPVAQPHSEPVILSDKDYVAACILEYN